MVSTLAFGSSGPGLSGPGSSPEQGLTLTMPLSAQVYKWVLVNLMLGATVQWTSIPSREE